MTKLRALTSITAVLAFAAALAGCPMDNDEDIIPAPLPAPQASLYGSLLSWPAIPGAGGYTVHAGDLRENIPATGTGARQTDLADLGLPVGEHSVAVVALGVEGRSLDSPASEPLSFTVNCPDCGNYPCGCGDYPQPIEVEHYSTTIAGIGFATSGNIPDNLSAEQSKALQARIDAIRDQFAALDADALAGFTPYTDSLTVGIHPIEGGRIVGLNEENKAVIYTDSTSADGIMADLAYGRDMARAEREAAEEAAYWATIVTTPTNINNAGISFQIAGGILNRAQVRDIRTMVEGMNVAEFTAYVTSVEFALNIATPIINPGTGEQAMATILIDSEAAANAVRNALIAARDEVRIVRSDAYDAAIVNTPTNVSHGGVDFQIAAGMTRAEVSRIRAVIEQGIEVVHLNDLAGYINRVLLEQNVPGGRHIDPGTGENATATVRIESTACAITIFNALNEAKTAVRDVRYAAFQTANPIYSDPITRGGITFQLGTGVDGSAAPDAANNAQLRAQIAAITATIASLNTAVDLNTFASYITNVTFSNIATPTSTVTGAGANTTATIEVPYGITATELLAFLEQTQSDVETQRDTAPTEPTMNHHVTWTDPGGWASVGASIDVFIEDGIANLEAVKERIATLSNINKAAMAANINIINIMSSVDSSVDWSNAAGTVHGTINGARIELNESGLVTVWVDPTQHTDQTLWWTLMRINEAARALREAQTAQAMFGARVSVMKNP